MLLNNLSSLFVRIRNKKTRVRADGQRFEHVHLYRDGNRYLCSATLTHRISVKSLENEHAATDLGVVLAALQDNLAAPAA